MALHYRRMHFPVDGWLPWISISTDRGFSRLGFWLENHWRKWRYEPLRDRTQWAVQWRRNCIWWES